MVRVAVLQIERSSPDEDVASCLRQIDRAASDHHAVVLVCPELRVEGDGSEIAETSRDARLLAVQEPFAERARRHGVWIGLSLSGPGLSLRTWLTPEGAASHAPGADGPVIVETPHGMLGLCCGAAALESASARELTLLGAAIVCAPLALLPAAEAALQVPARAVENGIYVAVAAVFESAPAPADGTSATLPPEPAEATVAVRGAASQIVGPDGRALSVAEVDRTGLAVADVEPAHRGELADGTRLVDLRRPELYRFGGRARRTGVEGATVRVAALDVAYVGSLEETVAAAVADIGALAAAGTSLIVLPELFCFESVSVENVDAAADQFGAIVRELARACRAMPAHVVTSLVERSGDELTHVGLVVGQGGVVARQCQLHIARRVAWARPGRRLECVRLPWGNLTIAVGEDALMPELLRTSTAQGVEIVAAPLSSAAHAPAALTLPALAAELQLGVVAAFHAEPEPDRGRPVTSFIVDPSTWPALRALPGERLLEGALHVRGATRAARVAAVDSDAYVTVQSTE